MGKYIIKIESVEKDEDLSKFGKGIECDRFTIIGETEEAVTECMHGMSIDMLAKAISKTVAVGQAALLGTAYRLVKLLMVESAFNPNNLLKNLLRGKDD